MQRTKNALTRKLGPLPVWAWTIIGGIAVFWYRNRSGSTSTASTATVPTATAPYPTDGGGGGYGGWSSQPGGGGNSTTAAPVGQDNQPTTSPPTAPVATPQPTNLGPINSELKTLTKQLKSQGTLLGRLRKQLNHMQHPGSGTSKGRGKGKNQRGTNRNKNTKGRRSSSHVRNGTGGRTKSNTSINRGAIRTNRTRVTTAGANAGTKARNRPVTGKITRTGVQSHTTAAQTTHHQAPPQQVSGGRKQQPGKVTQRRKR
jgi:hypothetical protein